VHERKSIDEEMNPGQKVFSEMNSSLLLKLSPPFLQALSRFSANACSLLTKRPTALVHPANQSTTLCRKATDTSFLRSTSFVSKRVFVGKHIPLLSCQFK
jgi:hypothetical protein